jgi:hypothetical protein
MMYNSYWGRGQPALFSLCVSSVWTFISQKRSEGFLCDTTVKNISGGGSWSLEQVIRAIFETKNLAEGYGASEDPGDLLIIHYFL